MSQRDQKTVMLLVLGVVGAGIAFWLLNSWFLSPYNEYTRQIAALKEEVEAKEDQVSGIRRDKILLEKAKARSLPGSQVKASADYHRYLETLLEKSGLTDWGVTPGALVDPKIGPAAPLAPNAPKKPGHTVLTYGVHAKGSLANVVKALENLQKTPVLHRVKQLQLGRQDNAKDTTKDNLTITMTLEAMIATGIKSDAKTPALEPNTSMLLPTAANARHYADIAKKNIFIGPVPPPPPQVAKTASTEPTEEEEAIPQYVSLVSTEPSAQEAFLRTKIFKMRETRLWSKEGSPYNSFRILNEDGTKVLLKAVVLRIDQREVYFQVREDVYGIHIGGTIAEAMRRPLSDGELERLELTELVRDFDPKSEPAKKEVTKKASKAGKKKG